MNKIIKEIKSKRLEIVKKKDEELALAKANMESIQTNIGKLNKEINENMQILKGNSESSEKNKITVLKTENNYCFIEILKNESSDIRVSHLIVPTLQSFSDLEIERKQDIIVRYEREDYHFHLPWKRTNAFLYYIVNKVFQQFDIITDSDLLTLSQNKKNILNNDDELFPHQIVNVYIKSGQKDHNSCKDNNSVMEFNHLTIQLFFLYRSIACDSLIMRLENANDSQLEKVYAHLMKLDLKMVKHIEIYTKPEIPNELKEYLSSNYKMNLIFLNYSSQKRIKGPKKDRLPDEVIEEIIDMKKYNVQVLEEDLKEINQNIALVHQQFDSLLSRCNEYIKLVKKGESVNMEDLSTTNLFTFTKQSTEYLKRNLDLDIKTNIHNIKMCSKQIELYEKNLRITAQTKFWINGCETIQSNLDPERMLIRVYYSLIRNNRYYDCSVYSSIPPNLREFFNNMDANEEIRDSYFLQIDKRICCIIMYPHYSCSIIYFLVRTLLRAEMIIKEEDDFELYIGGNKIDNTNILITDLECHSNELTMKIIPKEEKKQFFRCTITKLNQLDNIPDNANYIVLDLSSYTVDVINIMVSEFVACDFTGIERVDIITNNYDMDYLMAVDLIDDGVQSVVFGMIFDNENSILKELVRKITEIKSAINGMKKNIEHYHESNASLLVKKLSLDK